eukprot:gene16660-19798_t
MASVMDPRIVDKNIVFIPINNNTDPNVVAGGSHWSLLVFVKQANTFYHYDSMRGSNRHAALSVARKLSVLLRSGGDKGDVVMLERKQSPQQSNCYDCGLYVLSNVELLSNLFIASPPESSFAITDQIESTLTTTIVPYYVANKRQTILNIIKELQASRNL